MRKQKVWVGMKAVDKKVGGSPCKDCKDRRTGCHGECEHYIEWQCRRKQEREAYYKENGGDLESDLYAIQSFNNMQRKKGKQVKER